MDSVCANFFLMCGYLFSWEGRFNFSKKKMKLKPDRIVSADVTLKRFPNKVLKGRRKPTLNMGAFKVSSNFIYLT